MCMAQRCCVYGLIGGVLCCVAGLADAQQTDPTSDPFSSDPKPKVVVPSPSTAMAAEQPAAIPPVLSPVAGNSRRGVPIDGADSLSVAKIRRVLGQHVELSFVDTPLGEVVEYLKELVGIQLVIDKRALDDVGLGSDAPVTIAVKGISLRSMLRLMLSELDLTFIVRNEVLMITTPEGAENELDTRIYRVAELSCKGTLPILVDEPVSRFRLLKHIVTTLIAPDSWKQVGGAGDFTPYDDWGVVAISQTEDVHQQIEVLLATLVRAQNADPMRPRDALVFPVVKKSELEAYGRIERALLLEASFDFEEVTLGQVAEHLRSRFDIPIVIDRRALDDIGLGCDTPVTVSLHGISLRSALRLMLAELDLTYTITDEVLKITTREEAEHRQVICIYPVCDFIDTPSPRVTSETDRDALWTMLISSVAPNSWDYVGGAGSALTVAPWGLLIVSQTNTVHEQVRGLLTAARRARAPASETDGPPAPLPLEPPNPFGEPGSATQADPFTSVDHVGAPTLGPPSAMILKRYVLADGVSVDQVSRLISGTVSGAAWNPPAAIFPVGNGLFIRQTEAAHQQIKQLLRSAGISHFGMGGKGFMGGGFMGGGGMEGQVAPNEPMPAMF